MQTTWKTYLQIIGYWFIGFYFATFCIALYYQNRGQHFFVTLFLFVFYLTLIVASLLRMLRKLPMQVIMLLAPTAPLLALFMVVSLIPILQYFR